MKGNDINKFLNDSGTLLQKVRKLIQITTVQILGDFAQNFGATNFIIMRTILGQQMLLNSWGKLLQKGRKSF